MPGRNSYGAAFRERQIVLCVSNGYGESDGISRHECVYDLFIRLNGEALMQDVSREKTLIDDLVALQDRTDNMLKNALGNQVCSLCRTRSLYYATLYYSA